MLKLAVSSIIFCGLCIECLKFLSESHVRNRRMCHTLFLFYSQKKLLILNQDLSTSFSNWITNNEIEWCSIVSSLVCIFTRCHARNRCVTHVTATFFFYTKLKWQFQIIFEFITTTLHTYYAEKKLALWTVTIHRIFSSKCSLKKSPFLWCHARNRQPVPSFGHPYTSWL